MLTDEIDRARELYRKALLLEKRNPVALFKYGCFKEYTNEPNSASKYYKMTLSSFPDYSMCHVVFADLLTNIHGQHDKAEYHYKEALRVDPTNPCGLNNYAVFLVTVKRNIEEAHKFFVSATRVASPNPVHIQNYAIFLSKVWKDEAKARKFNNLSKELRQSRQ
mgnify:CR=1 FL=1